MAFHHIAVAARNMRQVDTFYAAATGFELAVADDVTETRVPSDEELRIIRERLDPAGAREREVPS